MAILGQSTDPYDASAMGPILGAPPPPGFGDMTSTLADVQQQAGGLVRGMRPAPIQIPETVIGGREITLPETVIGGRGVMLPETVISGAPTPRALAPGFGDMRGTLSQVGAETARLARQPRLSEIGTIEENLARAGEREAAAALDRARAQGPEAVRALEAAQEAERVSQAERVQLAGERAEQTRIAEEDAAIERQQRRAAVQEAQSKYAAAEEDLANTKIDVAKAYGGTGGQILSAIAVALGAFGASMTGGPNYAMQIVNDRVNRELDAQKSEIDKKKGKVTELGRLLQRNETLLGDAEQARTLARAQTYKALADDLEARAKGRELSPQQAQVLGTLREQQAQAQSDLQVKLAKATEQKLLVGATERARMMQAQAQAATAARSAEQKRREKIFESELKTQEALGIEAGKKMIEQGMVEPGQAPPKAVEKVLDTMAKPAIGTKDVVGALQQLSNFEQAIMSYGSPERAPGGSTYGFAQALTPDLREQARALSQTRIQSILDYRRAQTGTAASAAEEKRIMTAAGGDDPTANMRWIQSQRSKLLGELDTALKTIPESQRAAVKAQILQAGGAATVQQVAGAKPVTKMP